MSNNLIENNNEIIIYDGKTYKKEMVLIQLMMVKSILK